MIVTPVDWYQARLKAMIDRRQRRPYLDEWQ
jgi:hypothetical protein